MTRKMMMMTALLGAVLLACPGCAGESSATDSLSSTAETTTSSAETTTSSAATTTSQAADTTAAPATTSEKPADTTQAPATAPAETTTKATESGSSSAELTVAQAKEIMAALQKVDGWGASVIDMDMETTAAANDTMYCKVTDPAYKSTADVRRFMTEHMTDAFIEENYSNLLGGDKPYFIDADGALYVQNSPHGYKYIFTDTAPTLEKTMEDGYTIYCFISDMGQEQAVLLFVNDVGGTWKLSGVSFGM